MTASLVGTSSASLFLGPRSFDSPETVVEPVVVDAGPTEFLRVPKAFFLDADFVRQGADLLLVGANGAQFLVRDYFSLSRPPALHTEEGAVLPADLVRSLAGPAAPAQYAQLGPEAIAAPIGRVATIEGTVTATRSDGSVVQLAIDSPVLQGDVLETGADSRLGVVFNDDTTFALGENACMVLDEFIYDPSTHEGISAVSVVKGVFVFVSGQIAAHNPDEMVVRTPTTVIGIRGTKVAGKAAAEGENSTFVLLPDEDGTVGTIVVRTFAGELVINAANASVVVRSAFLPPERVEISGIEFNSLFASVLQALPSSPDDNREDHGSFDDLGLLEVDTGGIGPMQGMFSDDEEENLSGTDSVDDLTLDLEGALFGVGEIIGELAGVDPFTVGDFDNTDSDDDISLVFEGAEELVPPEEFVFVFDLIVGGVGDDVLLGGDGADSLVGGLGNDQVFGGPGGDTVLGGGGNDTVSGGPGNDNVQGGSGDDVLSGGEDNDLLNGGNDNDTVSGGDGDDRLFGSAGDDSLLGDAGGDNLDGGPGMDVVDGGPGDDVVAGGLGDDTLRGGPGDDMIVGGSGEGNDSLDGGPGNDTVNYSSANQPIVVDLSPVPTFGGFFPGFPFGGSSSGSAMGNDDEIGSDSLVNIENVIGGSSNDLISGDNGANNLSGGPGNDTISGLGGNDTVEGGDGDDVLSGGGGNDSVVGGNGNDVFDAGTDGGNDTYTGGTGSDVVSYESSPNPVSINGPANVVNAGGQFGLDTILDAEVVIASLFGDVVQVIGAGGQFDGGGGNDSLSGGAGADTFSGGDGDDQIDGGGGDDSLAGGAGNDAIDGNDGDDIIHGVDGFDSLVGSAGNDTIHGGPGNDRITVNGGLDQAFGEDGEDVIIGGADSDSLFGGAGDSIDGGAGIDFLLGEAGADTLSGGGDGDSLLGGDDGDDLRGDAGDDTLDGEAGDGDAASYADASGQVTVDLAGTTAMGGGVGMDELANIENAIGSGFNDSLIGDATPNDLFGGDGEDTLEGGGGDDTFDGGLGDDFLDGGEGARDVASFASADNPVTVDLDVGTSTGALGTDMLMNLEDVVGGDFADTIRGDAQRNLLFGGLGDDVLSGGDDTLEGDEISGGEGADDLSGDGGDDTLRGDEGDDILNGGAGDDELIGGEGLDAAEYDDPVTIDLDQGTAQGADVGTDTLSEIEIVRGSEMADTLISDIADETLDGRGGDDTADFGHTNDGVVVDLAGTVATGASIGTDTLLNIEVVLGGTGADTLMGGDGIETLRGGDGTD